MLVSFDIKTLGRENFHEVVQKLELKSALKLQKSCREIKETLDKSHYNWVFPGSKVNYQGTRRWYMTNHTDEKGQNYSCAYPNIPVPTAIDFISFQEVSISACERNFFNLIVIPELSKMKSVKMLYIHFSNHEDIERVIQVLRPLGIQYNDIDMDENLHGMEIINSLNVTVHMSNEENYWKKPKRLFEMGRTRDSLSFRFNIIPSSFISSFLLQWFKGEDVGTLNELGVYEPRDANKRRPETLEQLMRSILEDEEIKALTKIERTEKGMTIKRKTSIGFKDSILVKFFDFFVQFHFK